MSTYIGKPVAQGDVLFIEVEALPAGAVEHDDVGKIVVAHSETGHHHTVDAARARRFEVDDPLVCYLRVTEPFAEVVHERAWDTHAPIRLLGGGRVHEVRRQREATPDGWERVRD